MMQLTKSSDVALQHEALAPCSRARIEGFQGRPEINGRMGVICGRLQQASIMVGLKEVQAALNAPGLVTTSPFSFNQLKVELAKKLHIQADDEVFTEHKQAIKDSYVQVFICGELEQASMMYQT